MSTEIIDTVEAERTNLDLHVDLCATRYAQLINKFDDVETRFVKIENMLIDIKDSISSNKSDNTEKYLKWGGATIFVLTTTLVGILMHLLFK